jgi:hypothetical protein
MDVEPPRLINESETAHHLGMSVSEFSRRAAEFEEELGMPRRHPVLKKRDKVAIDQWLNRVFHVKDGSISVSDLVRQRMEALSNGKGAHPALSGP